jgi:hypothetical protein
MESCNDCGVAVDEYHQDGCDVERCPVCGGQYISCDCDYDCNESPEKRIKWNGEWPGKKECREFGWYSKFVEGKGWVKCPKEDPKATEDLNRLAIEAVWDVKLSRYVKP